jgi:hypothetical protein
VKLPRAHIKRYGTTPDGQIFQTARGGVLQDSAYGAVWTEVARRAGHGVAVLLKIYAHCIDGQADAANKRITDALGVQDTQPEAGDEGDDYSAQTS